MKLNTSVLLPHQEVEKSLSEVLAALSAHDDLPLIIEYGGRRVQPGYHVTEVKAGSFATLDCGGNPDAWHETVLQVEDLPAEENQSFMKVGKFRAILGMVSDKVALDQASRLTFEISSPDAAMQIFDVNDLVTDHGHAVLRLVGRSAICKPRHRAARVQGSDCCTSSQSSGKSACCSTA